MVYSQTFGRASTMRIALLEDDPSQVELLKAWLQEAGHNSQSFANSAELLRCLGRESFDVMVFDWEVPGLTGLELMQKLRSERRLETPIVFLTNRDNEDDIVAALNAGADDYVIKPARRVELLARLNAAVRKRGDSEANENKLFAPYMFTPTSQSVSFNGQVVPLTTKEFDLALFLFKNAGKLVSRNHILESVWGSRGDLNTRTVDTHVSLVRQKLALGPENGWRLGTVYRHGYRLEHLTADAST